MSTRSKKLGFREKLAYGMGDCGANVYVAMAGTFLTGYYTDTVGLAVAAVGTMMLLPCSQLLRSHPSNSHTDIWVLSSQASAC